MAKQYRDVDGWKKVKGEKKIRMTKSHAGAAAATGGGSGAGLGASSAQTEHR